MYSTMQDFPLTITTIMKFGAEVFGAAEVATWTGDGARRRTYAEVGERAARLAGALRGLGVDGDQRVATFMWNNAEHLEAYLAVPSMGAVLHTLNLRLFPDQLVYIANHAEDRVVLVDGSLIPLLAPVLPQFKTVQHVVVVGGGDTGPLEGAGKELHDYEALLAAAPAEFAWPDVDEQWAAAMCYTSGTTGNPKGVVYSHRSAYLHSMATCTGNAIGLSASDVVMPVVPMFHANAWGLPYAALMAGASLVMPDRFLQADPLVRMIEAERPTVAGAVPTIWSDVLRHTREHESDLSSLRLVPCGGSAVPESLMRGFDEIGVRIVQAWGMTETSPVATVAHPPVKAADEDVWRVRLSQGRVLAGLEMRVVGDGDVVLPNDGESVGEVEIRGPWITGAYHLDEDPAKFHDGWLRTGDVGTLSPDGHLLLTDRAKDVIKSGGEWISSVELENHLMAHPDVVEAAVVGVPDDRWQERPLASVVVREGARVTAEQLKEFLAGRIAKWQLPERWAFIAEVPKTSVGKFDKKVLRRRYAEGELEVRRAD
ncbi:long-chain fatty acid--CoA ligase [Actinomadura madurae]|uniref:long-chain fatty acid--CoA ligase n=1 Tax=Actinomadura madurae TaxID=1993 RepID=UPI0020D22292|nr:long-chain fatty acid--CoA ligase [Actinomadura madurae]MCP9952002.1 long-chain fatty acid--CoA ligase [Actinomadura madurae]MCQ0007257.1 long-chain fatty acid--CoA ligase [Actinomadura madurae]MCQ0017441.1 long-chain fatty acid--CoA ligase [Actinomadura madurae]